MSESDTKFNERDQRCAAVQSCSLPIQVMTTRPLPALSKCKSGRFNVPRVMKTKFPATFMVFGVVSSEGHIMPPNIFEVGLKVNAKVYLDVQTLGVAAGLGTIPQVQRDPGLASEGMLRLCTLLSLAAPPHSTWTRWTTSFGHTSRASPTCPPKTPKPAWSPPSAEYSPSSSRRLWKMHAP